jgi:hypothetical protein
MHCSDVLQQSFAVEQCPSRGEHPCVGLHCPAVHVPPQQSMPVAHDCPFGLQGASVANARMLPLPSSCPGK